MAVAGLIAVSDSSPIILLAKIGRFALLRDLFDEVVIPAAVQAEVLAGGGGRPGAAEAAAAPWIRVQPAIAQEMSVPATLILDDAAGRRLAREFGLSVLGSAGLLVQAKEQGVIPSVRPILDDLRAAGLFLSDALYHRLLTGVREAPDEAGPNSP